jgi:CRP/FNR family cyclic AMP-dependent transcriptional regulator
MNTASEVDAVTPKRLANARRLHAEIAAHPFAKGLSREHLMVLADCAMETHFAPGELIFREGDIANRFFLLLEGEVALENRATGGDPVLIETIGGNDVLGWSWLFSPYYWHFDARAVKPTRAIFFYGTWLRERCEQDHQFGYELIKRMAEVVIQRLQATRRQLLEASALALLSQKLALETIARSGGIKDSPTRAFLSTAAVQQRKEKL